MFIFKKATDLQKYLDTQRSQNKTIGFAPTMGALHAGHLSLISAANQQNDITVCSIFVNPTQFNDPNDLAKYPRTEGTDIELLAFAKCTVLFLPSVAEIYPDGTNWQMPYQFGTLTQVMEGEHRPGHFEGMVQVVKRLLDIVSPDHLYMGQKDFQQQTIIKSMLEQSASNIELVRCAILREKDGLAMSSRNIRLTPDERAIAPRIYAVLQAAKAEQETYTPIALRQRAIDKLHTTPEFSLDYLEIVAADTLLPITN